MRNNLFRIFLAIVLALVQAATAFGQTESGTESNTQETGFPTAREIAREMYPGWNLGNTLDATGGEIAWQETRTSQELIDFIKAKGFRSVRIPCCWYIYQKDGGIDPVWMNRVQEIVDYCIKDGLYVVLNDHWDTGWIEVEGFSKSQMEYEPVDKNTVQAKITILKAIWTAIANKFKDYDEYLLFAGMNEPMQEYQLFNGRRQELTPILQQYNQAFVDAVRATGGRNQKRILVVQGAGANFDDTYNFFYMPRDVNRQTGRIMAEVHFYEPWDFTGGMKWYYWGEGNFTKADAMYSPDYLKDEQELRQQFSKMYERFVKLGIPVIIGEYGVNWRDLTGIEGTSQKRHDASVRAYHKAVNKTAISMGMIPFVWDINALERNGVSGISTIFNRTGRTVFNKLAYEGIMEGVKEAKWPEE